MNLERQSTALPPAPRKRGRDWGRVLARVFCVLFAIVGLVPLGLTVVVRSAWAQKWAARETERILREQKLDAKYKVGLRLWPLAVELRDVEVASTDGGGPALSCARLAAQPRFFALFSGKLVVQQIEADTPHVRVVMRQGQFANLDLKLEKSSDAGGPFHAPFGVVALTDADLDLDVDGTKVVAHEVDADVTVEDDREHGSSFEVALRVGSAQLHASRLTYPSGDAKPPVLAVDEDALCGVDARVRIEPSAILVRRLEAEGSADLDTKEGSLAQCGLPANDKRRVELTLAHLRVRLPEKEGDRPRVDGHAKVRVPVGLAERFAKLPETDGWVMLDADVRYAADTIIPDVSGHIEAHDIRLDHYNFARELQADIAIRRDVITSPALVVHIADGVATISDVTVEPLQKGVPLKARVDVRDANFTTLMYDLGVAKHSHVQWDLKEVHMPVFKGTIVPLKLDGDFTAHTPNFMVADAPIVGPHGRIIGVKDANVQAHLAVRPEAVEFQNATVITAGSKLTGGLVSLGYNNDLNIRVPQGSIDLQDLGPLGSIPIAGIADVDVHVGGTFGDPRLEGDVGIQGFNLGDIPFGNVTSAHVKLTGLVVDLSGARAVKGKSAYEMPTARLDFGHHDGLHMDAVATSAALGVRDFLAIWKMEDDPRFAELDGSIATRANLHIALGGPEDVCGLGFIDVRATAHIKDVKLYGETFEDGDLDLEYKWTDRGAGIEGADVDIRAVTLHKAHPPGGVAIGSLLGSGTIQRGGDVHGSVVVEALPLSRVDSLGAIRRQIEGSASGIAQVSGKVDAFTIATDLDVTPIRVRGAPLGSSHVRVTMTQKASDEKPVGRTKCGGRIMPAFSKEAYLRDTSSQGTLAVDGELFGGQLKLEGFSMTREKAPLVTGRALLRKLDLGALAKMQGEPESKPAEGGPPPAVVTGELSGDLTLTRLKMDDLGGTRARFAPQAMTLERGGQKLVLRPAPVNFVVENDKLLVPPLVFDVNANNGLKGSFIVRGGVDRLTRDAALNLTAELLPVDLGFLVGVAPKVERASGTLRGLVKLGGTAKAPALDGEVKVQDGELAVHGLPGAISEIDVDVRADVNEIRISRASAKFLGGTVTITDGRVPLKEMAFGAADAQIAARGIRYTPADGVATTLDADLALSFNAQATGSQSARLPHVTGDVLLTSFEYTRSINLLTDLGAFKVGGARRTVVESYDPSQDAIVFDVRVRSRQPLKIKNNLVESQLAIDSGVLTVSGTNQRIGLRGTLKALPGGRFRFLANEFEVRQAFIGFEDPTRIAPNVDIVAVTEYRRYTDTSAGAAAGAGTSDVGAAGGAGSGRVGGLWRIQLHAFGDADNVRLELTSDPALSDEDIKLLLTLGMTRSEIDQVGAAGVGTSVAFQAVGAATGADRAVKAAIPVIDDFRFGSAYSSRTGRTEPQLTVGRRITDNVRASVTTGLTEDRELRSNIEWRLSQKLSVQSTYDNINDVSSSAIGNVGGGFRWRLEFE
jgi:translocation and assembly module TamB